jgi:hypothetical protein
MIRGNTGKGGASLESLLRGMDELIASNTKFDNFGKLTGTAGMNHSVQSFAEGARWTQRYIVSNVDEFKGKTLKFEQKVVGQNRYIDVILDNGEVGQDIFYEFKSVKSQYLPPERFKAQFLGDLKNRNVTELSQLKWYFDGSKVSGDLPKEKFMDILEKADIDDDVVEKFVDEIERPTKSDLLDLIDENFDEIFITK